MWEVYEFIEHVIWGYILYGILGKLFAVAAYCAFYV